MKVRGIGASKHKSTEFAALLLYFLGKNDAEQLVYAALKCEIDLIKGLRANSLIGNDILSLKGIVIDINRKSALIGSCEVTITINAKQQRQFLVKKLFAGQETVVSSCSKAMISLQQVPLTDNQDFLFYLTIQANLTLYSHIVDHEISKVLSKTLLIDFCVFPDAMNWAIYLT